MRFQRFWLHSQAYKSVLDRPYRPKPTDRATRPDPTGRQTDPTNPRPTDQPTDPDPTRPRSRGTIQWIVFKNNNNILILYNFPLYCTARPRGLGPLGDLRDVGSGFLHLQRPNDAVSSRAGSWRTPVFLLHPILPKNRGNYVHFFQGVGAGRVTKRGKHVFGSTCDELATEKHERKIVFFIKTTIPFDIFNTSHKTMVGLGGPCPNIVCVF